MVGSSRVEVQLPAWVGGVALLGILGVTAYVAAWAIAGALWPAYAPTEQAISELFAIGAPQPGRGLVIAGLLLSGVALIVFAAALDRGLPGTGMAAPVCVALSGILTVAVVAFPCTEGCPGAGTTFTDTMHVVTAGGGYLALLVAPLFAAWRVRHAAPRLAAWSVVLGGIALAGFVVRNLGVADDLGGLQQRTFNTVADLWYVVVGLWLLRRTPLWPG